MFGEMVLYHSILVYALLLLELVGLSIIFLGDEYKNIVKRLRLYMFIFHGVVTAVAFSGLVAFIFAKMDFSLNILSMVFIYFTTTTLESLKYLKIVKESETVEDIRSLGVKYTLINIALIVVLIVSNLTGG